MADAPKLLFKYLNPNRLDVLSNCKIRFSQRSVFEDDHELQPDYELFGTVDEIKRHIERTGTSGSIPGIPDDVLAQLIHKNPKYQQSSIESVIKHIKSLDQLGILCLTVTPSSERMWKEYSADATGFVLAFDTTHEGFKKLTHPRGVRPVEYSDKSLATFLGVLEKDVLIPLFRKREKYSFEQEWRSLRLFKDLESHPGDVYLTAFDPACLSAVILGAKSDLEDEVRATIGGHARYGHVAISRAAC